MIEIIPAILPKNYEELKNKVALVRGIVPIVQVDICDGIFVGSTTWPFLSKLNEGDFFETNLDTHFRKILNEEEGMPFWEDIDFELDLMVHDAVKNFDIYTKLGAKKIVFHIEAVGDREEFKDFLEGMDVYIREIMEVGIAINPATPLDKIYSLIPYADFVQCMGNDNIGHQGISLDENIYEKITALRKKYPEIPIAVDIGVNETTAQRLIDAGATKLIIGSAIFNSEDIIEKVKYFSNL